MTEFVVTFLGTGGTAPSPTRGMPATLIKHGGTKILVDCGEGTQRQIWQAEDGLVDLDAIFLTHYHSDHILGLPGLLNSYQLRGRERPLPIYGPKPLLSNLRRFNGLVGKKTLAMLEPTEATTAKSIKFGDSFEVFPIPVLHAGGAYGYALREKNLPGRFNVEKAKNLGIFPGPDFGKLQAGHTVRGIKPEDVIGPERPGRKVVISGDTAPHDGPIRVFSQNADLLIHEATLLEDDQDRSLKTEHSSALDAAKLARAANVKRLALYHISPRHRSAKPILKEAWKVYMGATVPNDFDRVEIPHP